MAHWEDDPDIQKVRDAAKGGRISEYLFERARARDRAMIAENPRWHWWLFVQVPLGFTVYLVSIMVIVVTDHDSWWFTAAVVALGLVASRGLLGSLGRAQSYRNGWIDRGNHDKVVHLMTCDDDTLRFEQAVRATNMDAHRRI